MPKPANHCAECSAGEHASCANTGENTLILLFVRDSQLCSMFSLLS